MLARCSLPPCQGVRVVLTDGQSHAVDSNEMAFRIASINAFRQVCREVCVCAWPGGPHCMRCSWPAFSICIISTINPSFF